MKKIFSIFISCMVVVTTIIGCSSGEVIKIHHLSIVLKIWILVLR